MELYYIEFEDKNAPDGKAMVYSEKVDGLDPDAIQVVGRKSFTDLLAQAKNLRKVAVVSDQRDEFDKFLESLGDLWIGK